MHSDPRSSDNTSVTSTTSTVTMETVNTIIKNKLTAITAHIWNNDRKFDELMNILKSNSVRGQDSSANSQICTSAVGLFKAGEDTVSVSSNVH
jgi:mitochondrial fission protein ELM1